MNKKNCIMALMCALSVLLSSFSLVFESKAADVYVVPYSQPPTGINNGYVNVLWVSPTGVVTCDTFWWYIAPFQSVGSSVSLVTSSMDLQINSSGYINFTAKTAPEVQSRFVLYKLNQDGSVELRESTNFVYQIVNRSDYSSAGYTIKAFQCFGNVGALNTDITSGIDKNFTVLYSDEALDYDLFQEMAISLGQLVVSNQSIFEQLFESNSNLRKIWKNQDDLEEWLAEALALIDAENKEQNAELDRIYAELQTLHKDLLESSQSDSNKTDDFTSDSDNQSSTLNELNEQNKMDKINVDSASSSVDANIDSNAISNYGVVLSNITGNAKVIQLMLIVLSVGLVSYVLFGKR